MRDPITATIDANESLPSLVTRLAGETRALATAELGVYRAKLGSAFAAYKSAAVFFAIAGVLALAGLIALLVGLTLTVATLVGPGWATLIVVGVVFVIAAILALVGKSKLTPGPEAADSAEVAS